MRQVPVKKGASDEYTITFHDLVLAAISKYQLPHMASLIREFFSVIFPECCLLPLKYLLFLLFLGDLLNVSLLPLSCPYFQFKV